MVETLSERVASLEAENARLGRRSVRRPRAAVTTPLPWLWPRRAR